MTHTRRATEPSDGVVIAVEGSRARVTEERKRMERVLGKRGKGLHYFLSSDTELRQLRKGDKTRVSLSFVLTA